MEERDENNSTSAGIGGVPSADGSETEARILAELRKLLDSTTADAQRRLQALAEQRAKTSISSST